MHYGKINNLIYLTQRDLNFDDSGEPLRLYIKPAQSLFKLAQSLSLPFRLNHRLETLL